MKVLLQVEVHRWVRTRRLLIAAFIAAFVGFSAPLSAFLLPDLIALSTNSGIQIEVPKPGWVDLIDSYFRTSSQVQLLVLAFVAGTCAALGGDERLQLFYRSRTRSGLLAFGPRVIVMVPVVLLVVALGAGTALYETWALTPDLHWYLAVPAIATGVVGLTGFVLLAGAVSGITNSPFASTLVVVALVFTGSLVPSELNWSEWVPTRLLTPSTLLRDGSMESYFPAALSLLALLVIVVGVLLTRRLSRLPIHGRRRKDALD